MKKFIAVYFILALVMCALGTAGATPITFDLAGASGGSSVVAIDANTGFITCGDITATLASDLDSQVFSLGDGESKTVDFFSLKMSGISLFENYSIQATLGFDLPDIDALGSGGGTFSTFFGFISGGNLTWDPNTIPDTFTVAGNSVLVGFEQGCTIVFGDSVMVHATITNMGGAGAPVPEPATMLLLGTGLAGLAAVRRRKARKNSF